MVILASPKPLGHSPREIGGEDDGSALVEPADRMKEELFAANRPSSRHNTTNWAHTARIAAPLPCGIRRSASRPVSHISSILRCASCSSRRLDCTRLR